MKRLNNDDLVQIIDVEQGTKEWLEDFRGKGIGSSDVALLMNEGRLYDRDVGTLWKQKVGYEKVVPLDNVHIQRGKDLEPKIRDEVNKLLGTHFEPACVLRTDAPYLRASLDGIDFDNDCILEIKAPSEKVYSKYIGTWEIPENYYLQIQYQMLCANVHYAYYVFGAEELIEISGDDIGLYNGYRTEEGLPANLKIHIILIKNNHELQLDIERRCALFQKAVETKTPIGWSNGKLVLYDTNPTMFVVLGSFDNMLELDSIKNFPLPIYSIESVYPTKKSFVIGIVNYKSIVKLKDSNPHHHIKIINLTESPFSNKVSDIILDKKGLLKAIKNLL